MRKTLAPCSLLALLAIVAPSFTASAQAPDIEWQKCFGGSGSDGVTSMQSTPDGGYILCGSTDSNNGDASGHHGGGDAWVVKLDANGTLQWQRCLGGTDAEQATSIQVAPSGGYILCANASSSNGDVTGSNGGQDAWVVKLDANGAVEWSKCLGGTDTDVARFVHPVPGGGYILGGATSSIDGDVSDNDGGQDAWVVKLDANGAIEWEKCLGGTSIEMGRSIHPTTDGGYILCAFSDSNDGDVGGNNGGNDVWLVKLDANGVMQWETNLGGSANDDAILYPAPDGGYILSGSTSSNDGDVSGNRGSQDIWMVKTDANGVIQWQQCLGGTGFENGGSSRPTADGGYAAAGLTTSSNNGDVTGFRGGIDVWVVKLAGNGTLQWQKCMGGAGIDGASSILQTADGGYLVGGVSDSNNGDVSGGHGGADVWVVKLEADNVGMPEPDAVAVLDLFPNPAHVRLVANSSVAAPFMLMDAQGRNVMTGRLSIGPNTLDIAALSAGMYLLRLDGYAGGLRVVKE